MPSTDILDIAETLHALARKNVAVPWTNPNAIGNAREGLRASLRTVWKQWQVLAAENGWSVERLLRNVKARALYEDLPLLEKITELALEDAESESTRRALETLKLSFPKGVPTLA
ncbi:MAG: hypothetical protein WCL08_07420, partial [Verrucomicrobiota bacterium]